MDREQKRKEGRTRVKVKLEQRDESNRRRKRMERKVIGLRLRVLQNTNWIWGSPPPEGEDGLFSVCPTCQGHCPTDWVQGP